MPAVVAEAESWKPGCGGPRAPAAPTKNVSVVSAVRPAVSVTLTLKSYLPAARPVVRRVVVHAGAPASADRPGPAGWVGAPGVTGLRLIQSPPPAGAKKNSTEAMPASDCAAAASIRLAASGCSAAAGVRTMTCGPAAGARVAQAAADRDPTLPNRSVAATTYPLAVPARRPLSTKLVSVRPPAASVSAEPAASMR